MGWGRGENSHEKNATFQIGLDLRVLRNNVDIHAMHLCPNAFFLLHNILC